jgi:hypothetical protein
VRDWAILYQASVSEEGATTVRYWGQHVRVLILRVSLDPREILVPLTKARSAPSFGDAMKAEEMLPESTNIISLDSVVLSLDRRETG